MFLKWVISAQFQQNIMLWVKRVGVQHFERKYKDIWHLKKFLVRFSRSSSRGRARACWCDERRKLSFTGRRSSQAEPVDRAEARWQAQGRWMEDAEDPEDVIKNSAGIFFFLKHTFFHREARQREEIKTTRKQRSHPLFTPLSPEGGRVWSAVSAGNHNILSRFEGPLGFKPL